MNEAVGLTKTDPATRNHVVCMNRFPASQFGIRPSRPGLFAPVLCLCLLIAVSASVSAQTSQEQADQASRARELLSRARKAIGIDGSQAHLWGLSASAEVRRFAKYVSVQSPTKLVDKEKVISGKIEVDFLLPDKFRRRISSQTVSGRRYTYTDVANGSRAWRDPPPPVISSYRDNRVIDVTDIERSREKYADDARQQLALFVLAFLLETPTFLPSDFLYAGEIKEDDKVLDAIIVHGANGFRPVLLLDRATNLPHSIVASVVEPKRTSVIVEVASVSNKFISDTYARARREREARRTPAQRQEVQWRLSDYQPVSGFLLPRKLTTFVDGEMTEEMEINQFKINQPIDPKRFEGQPEVR